jgi:hypothetical protein
MKLSERLIGLLLVIVMFFSLVPNSMAQSLECESWSDVDVNSEDYQSLKIVCDLGWIKGGDDGSARLGDKVSRIEMVAIINRVFDLDVDSVSGELAFENLSEQFVDNEFEEFKESNVWMYKNLALGSTLSSRFNSKFWAGYPDETFKMGKSVNLTEFMKVFMLALEKQELMNGNFRLKEYAGDQWYHPYLNFLNDKGVVSVVESEVIAGENSFGLEQALTRRDVVNLIVRTLERDVYNKWKGYEFGDFSLMIPYYLKEVESGKENLTKFASVYDDLDLRLVKFLSTSEVTLPGNFVSVYVNSEIEDKVRNLYRTDRCSEVNGDCIRVYWFELYDGSVFILEGTFDETKKASGQEAVDRMMRTLNL